jgi:hypothetical protein
MPNDHYRLKKPCANCPFRKQGAIHLAPGRLDGIIDTLMLDDFSTFQCHKTVHSPQGGEWDDEGNYQPSGQEAMCAGAAAYLMKAGRPTVGMRVALITGEVARDHWEKAAPLVIDPQPA